MTLKYPHIWDWNGARKSYPNKRTLWCGPFSVAMVTGLSYEEAYEKCRKMEQRRLNAQAKRRGLRPGYWTAIIKGMHEGTLSKALGLLKVKCEWNWVKRKDLTLLTFAREHTIKGLTYIVVAGNHYVTIKDGVLYHSHHDPMPVEDAPKYRKARVSGWAHVRPLPAAIVG